MKTWIVILKFFGLIGALALIAFLMALYKVSERGSWVEFISYMGVFVTAYILGAYNTWKN